MLRPLQLGLFGLPDFIEVGVLALEPLDFLLDRGEPFLRRFVLFLLHRLALDLELDQTPVEPVHRLRLGVDLHLDPRRGFVDQIDRLVGQEAVGDVAVRQRRRSNNGVIGNPYSVVDLVTLLEATQDRDRVLDRGLADIHLLEAPLQSRVLLDVFAVLIECGGTDDVQLAARECGLQHVGSIDRAFGAAGTDQGVQLVDEDDVSPFSRRQFLENGFEPLLELATVLGACDQRADIEREQMFVLEGVRDVAIDDALRQALDDCSLADAGLANQHGVVLGTPRQHLHHSANLLVTADDGVELPFAGELGEVAREPLQRLDLALGLLVHDAMRAAHPLECGQ